MLGQKVEHRLGRTVRFETSGRYPVPTSLQPGLQVRFPIPGSPHGSFEIRAVPRGEGLPETFLLLHATAVRHKLGIPVLELEVEDGEHLSGCRLLRAEFDVGAFVWRSELVLGESEWVLATAVVPRAGAVTLLARFERLVANIKFTAEGVDATEVTDDDILEVPDDEVVAVSAAEEAA
jgi:hypothetical protein